VKGERSLIERQEAEFDRFLRSSTWEGTSSVYKNLGEKVEAKRDKKMADDIRRFNNPIVDDF